MTENTLKAIFRFDEQTSTLTPGGHNLTAAKAAAKTAELERQGLKVQALDQTSRHPGRLKDCEPCKTAAQNLSQKMPGEILGEEDTPEDSGDQGKE